MRIKSKFLSLTNHTYPHGKEDLLRFHLPQGTQKDSAGNYYIQVGTSNSMFTCHLDTQSRDFSPVKHIIVGEFIHTDKKTILGADDKAGMSIMLYMIENKIPGLYYFFIGEERGCIGSHAIADNFTKSWPNINKVVSFDRRGYSDVITHQLYGECCSNTFGVALATELNNACIDFKYKVCPNGLGTDSMSFQEDIPECTNISVGYFGEHTTDEKQDIKHLVALAKACLKVNWEKLPIVRIPKAKVIYSSNYKSGKNKNYKHNNFNHNNHIKHNKYNKNTPVLPTHYLGDGGRTFDENCYFYKNGIKTFISIERIVFEKNIIKELMNSWGFNVTMHNIVWNGELLTIIDHPDANENTMNRKELARMDSQMDLETIDATDLWPEEKKQNDYNKKRNHGKRPRKNKGQNHNSKVNQKDLRNILDQTHYEYDRLMN